MKPNEYQLLAYRTATGTRDEQLLHATLGIQTEAGEFADILKRNMFYGTVYDRRHAVEELGDLLWYVSLALTSLGITMEKCMKENTKKLKKRYPGGFTHKAVIERTDK